MISFVNPARAGMIPASTKEYADRTGKPRASRDDPVSLRYLGPTDR